MIFSLPAFEGYGDVVGGREGGEARRPEGVGGSEGPCGRGEGGRCASGAWKVRGSGWSGEG